MTEFSKQIWDMKYRYKDKENNPIDITVEDTWRRVAKGIAVKEKDKQFWEDEFYEILKDYKFLPGGRILSNAGTSRKKTTFFNCYVSGKIEDSIESIIDNVKTSALTQRGGGGIGFDFSSLRPKGAYVKGVEAQSSGPVSFMEIFNATCKTISSAGQRRGAMLAALRCDHPDIELFIDAKRDNVSLANFNLSVAITTTFIEAVKEDADWELSFEGKVYKTVKAKYLWDKIMKSTYDYAEPGILMVDTINEMNNLHYCEDIRTTNPCLTGDSMVAVADGRGSVSIKQLAEEEVDVPVYCIDNNKKTVVRTMQRPRKTGVLQEIFKITFVGGTSIKCTKNHKWLMNDFVYKKTSELKQDDFLHCLIENKNGEECVYQIYPKILPGQKVKKKCEKCGTDLVLEYSNREISCCTECGGHIKKGLFVNTTPDLEREINYKVQKENKRFIKTLSLLQIEKIEQVENEDVYNGTVAHFHNFYCTLPQNKKNKYLFLINCVNCGEIAMPWHSCCLLGSINLTKFVQNVFTNKAKIDYEAIEKTITTAVRLLDNVIDISSFPMKEYEKEAKDKRRMGMGITGLADVFTFLEIKYGSKESSEVAEKIMKTITEAAYKSSIELAKEKGQFPVLDKEAYLESNFVKQLSKEIQEGIKKYGIRNSHLTSIAPTGTISLYSGNVSSGLEPIFATSYNRKIRIENDEEQTQEIVDYAVQKYRDEKNTNELPEYFITTNDVLPEQHLEVQAVLQKWVDNSISKTINVPEKYPFEDFKNIYMNAYEKGLKGCTTFRPNPKRQGVLSLIKDDGFPNYTKIKRPEKLKCDIHKFRAGGEDWVAFVSLMNGRPFELFAGHHSEEYVKLPNKYENASMIKKKLTYKSKYTLELNNGDITVNDVLKYFPYDESFGALTRFISMNLQAGVPVKNIVEQLHKIKYAEFHHFNLGLARILKKYISDGEKGGKCEKCGGKLIYQSGCPTCSQCGFSKCG